MAKGYRAQWVRQLKFEWVYVYGAIEPIRGRCVFWIFSDLKKDTVKLFFEKFKEEVGGEKVIVLDNFSSHKRLEVEGIEFMYLPRYSPQLNPIEMVWREVKKEMANKIYESIEELNEDLEMILKKFYDSPEIIISLTCFPWWRKGICAIN